MGDYLKSPEAYKPSFMVMTNEERKKKILGMLGQKRAVGFLVTESFEIHISTNGEHKQLIAELKNPKMLEKGSISPSQNQIVFQAKDSFIRRETEPHERAMAQTDIRNKINEFLGTKYS